MNHAAHTQIPQLSPKMLAVLIIASTDFYLQESTKQFIDVKNQTVEWDQIFKLKLNAPHKTAMAWAHCIWENEIHPGQSPFHGVSEMDAELKRSILRALTLWWG